jgi:chromosome segregation ATPase
MSDPYRSLPESEPPGTWKEWEQTRRRVSELGRDARRFQQEIADRDAEITRLKHEVAWYKGLMSTSELDHDARLDLLAARLQTYESKYGSVDKVESIRQEHGQLTRALAGALERIAELEKKPA